MTLEEFEKSLIEGRRSDRNEKSYPSEVKSKKRRKHHHRDHHSNEDERHQHKRSRTSKDVDRSERGIQLHKFEENSGLEDRGGHGDEDEWVEKTGSGSKSVELVEKPNLLKQSNELKRDAWMEAPSNLDVEFRQRDANRGAKPVPKVSPKANFELKIHENELNKHHLQRLAEGRDAIENMDDKPTDYEANYTFGDAGSKWRMMKLKGVFRQAEESGKPVETVAIERFDDLRSFDEAREEQIELERRETYGKGYVGKDRPSGELFLERKLDKAVRLKSVQPSEEEDRQKREDSHVYDQALPPKKLPMDQTSLNKMRAQMLRAKMRGTSDLPKLEADYAKAMALSGNRQEADLVVLGAMENRMLTGGRNGEVVGISTKRGIERGLVEENEDMSIEDMVREERRTRNQAGGDGKRFAERIAKDVKFDTGLEYMEENANKLAKRVQKGDINLRNIAISDYQKMNRILDRCPLCHREDENTPPLAPVVSLATRVYLTLPTEPEVSDGGTIIVPIQHRGNLLECDDDEWEEIRNFMKSLIRMYHDQGRGVIFYENAAAPQRKKHAGMDVVPLPYNLSETAPAFFKEAILSADEEWTQHKKLIDTLSKAKQSLGKLAFRRTLVKEMPYFHVWFEIDGGLGHIVEDADRWPKGDLFAREIIGGMLEKGPEVVKRQGRWTKGGDRRVEVFRKRWHKFDWTKVLTDT
ncbi:hypothetical protein MMC07_000115 [Pseudocyphellaria aurata]|nr:hypothetical protein [Pseudocyphellaria aurata]